MFSTCSEGKPGQQKYMHSLECRHEKSWVACDFYSHYSLSQTGREEEGGREGGGGEREREKFEVGGNRIVIVDGGYRISHQI